MNVTEITTQGPIMENLNLVRISDDFDSDDVHLDHEEVTEAKADGHVSLLALLRDNCGSRFADILKATRDNGTSLTIDGDTVTADEIAQAFPAAAPKA